MIFIYHHLGLGDHIICNGLIRELYNSYKEISIYCKRENETNVKYMYRDLENCQFISVKKEEDICINSETLKIGFEYILFAQKFGITWDESFYRQCDIRFEKRWSSFYIKRDEERESILFEKLNPKKEPFALIHECGSDNIPRVKTELISKNLKQIKIKKGDTDNIFDYLLLAEKAEEIHCIDSSFKHLFDSFLLKVNLFYHNIPARGTPHQHKNKWKIV